MLVVVEVVIVVVVVVICWCEKRAPDTRIGITMCACSPCVWGLGGTEMYTGRWYPLDRKFPVPKFLWLSISRRVRRRKHFFLALTYCSPRRVWFTTILEWVKAYTDNYIYIIYTTMYLLYTAPHRAQTMIVLVH